MREPEKCGEKCVTRWEKKTTAQKACPTPYLHLEKRQEKMESCEALGRRENKYATANSATNFQAGIQDAFKEAVIKSNQEASLAVEKVKALTEKVNQLTEAMVLLTQSPITNQNNKRPRPPTQYKSNESNSKSESKSESEEEPSPPPKKKPW